MTEPADWKRVGELLQQQRVRLDPRYRNRTLFATERGINYKLVQDIETAARGNFDRATLTHIEIAYELKPGTIDEWSEEGRAPAGDRPRFSDPEEQRIADEVWEANAQVADDPALRWGFVGLAIRMHRERAKNGNGGAKQRRRA